MGRCPLLLVVLAVAFATGMAVPASAQMLRVEDENGTMHYTNSPCDPVYRRLAPGACRLPEVEPAATATEAAAPAEPVGPLTREIEQTATRHGVDRRLVEAVVQVESGGNPRAVSPKGALGVMQLMPARAEALGVRDVFDLRANLDGGVRHLRELLRRYQGNLHLALAAYNAGEEAVRVHGGIPPYRETQEYVRKVLSLYSPPAAAGAAPPVRSPRRPPAKSGI
jgi:soluble lytic murein transglycosylase-like protein